MLAAGATITERFKELLRARGIEEVILHESDARMAPAAPPPRPATALIDSELADRLDQLVDSGRLFIADSGPKFSERLQVHGCASYEPEQHAVLVEQYAANCALLDGLIKSVMHGVPVEGEQIAAVVAGYLTQFCIDADCVLEVANQIQEFASLAEQSLHTAILGMALAIEMGMAERDIRAIGLSGLLHAWGMTRVPEAIRNANRILSQSEFVEIQKHPFYTLDVLQRVSGIPADVPLICFQIHERPNGTGYPRGRRCEEIHPGARILHVANAFCALTSPRPFRLPLTSYAAVECLLRSARNRSVDPEVVRSLLHVVSLFPIGSFVVLNDTSVARVIRRNGRQYDCPIVELIRPPGALVDSTQGSVIIDTAIDERKIVRAMAAPGRQEIALRPDVLTLQRV